MAYIGNTPAEAFSAFQKQDFTTSATTSYTLDHPVANQNEIALFINFVRQEPTTAYTASGTSLTLTSATSSSDDMYCVYLGKAVQTVNPPSGSVGSSQVAASIITGQTALGATPADTDELLISDAGTLKRVDYSYLKSANTPAFKAYISTGQSIPDSTKTKVTFQTEMYDTDNAYDNSTNYRFTPQEAGKYFFAVRIRFESSSTSNAQYWIAKNGDTSVNTLPTVIYGNDYDMAYHVEFLSGALELNGSSDYVEVYVYQPSGGAVNISASFTSSFEGYKLIGV
jgi:hypothetical protein